MAKTNLKIGIIYQCYIFFHNQNVLLYVIINQCFVTVKSLVIWTIIIYVIHKSVFCTNELTPRKLNF